MNRIFVDIPYREIPLTQGKVALVDEEDYERIAAHKWNAHKDAHYPTFRARRNVWVNGKVITIPMSQEVLGIFGGIKIDHANHNTLDNRKQNLRPASAKQNGYNRNLNRNSTSGYKGVSFHVRDKIWCARIKLDGKLKHLGSFKTAEAAHTAYCDAAAKFYGEFACSGAVAQEIGL